MDLDFSECGMNDVDQCPSCFRLNRRSSPKRFVFAEQYLGDAGFVALRNFPSGFVFCSQIVLDLARKHRWSNFRFLPSGVLREDCYEWRGNRLSGEAVAPENATVNLLHCNASTVFARYLPVAPEIDLAGCVKYAGQVDGGSLRSNGALLSLRDGGNAGSFESRPRRVIVAAVVGERQAACVGEDHELGSVAPAWYIRRIPPFF